MSSRPAVQLRAFAAKLRGLLHGDQRDGEIDDEIQEHLQLLAERFVTQGMSREEAAAAARRQFGNATLLKEDRRELQTLPLEVFLADALSVKAYDPLTLAATTLLLTITAAIACWIPARRAARVDSMVALHYE